jgi:hypothetical protein
LKLLCYLERQGVDVVLCTVPAMKLEGLENSQSYGEAFASAARELVTDHRALYSIDLHNDFQNSYQDLSNYVDMGEHFSGLVAERVSIDLADNLLRCYWTCRPAAASEDVHWWHPREIRSANRQTHG